MSRERAESGRVVLGTAGHIDHGKTALVRALTGTDTDRLKEEKARGITIELGFAELRPDEGPRFGVVDVPGHEAFVRAMVAGATGMDIILLIVAADEGVMPQTLEHLAIAELLGVPELVVALTKTDLVDEDWLELVESVVGDTLADTPYAGAPVVPTSAKEGHGLPGLLETLVAASARVRERSEEDLCRLPLDRVFTIQGTGTVVTGTLWSGSVSVGERVLLGPGDLEARVRGVQVHGSAVERAVAGDRAAIALTGEGADRERLERGATLITEKRWQPSRMLTARIRMLVGPGWSLQHNQRVHVHLGTAEVRARCAVLEAEPLGPGGEGWVQLRLEEPLIARGRDRLVIRAYSPVTTIGGGIVAETHPPKRNRLDDTTRAALDALTGDDAAGALDAVLSIAGLHGVALAELPVRLGLSPRETTALLEASTGALVTQRRRRGQSGRSCSKRSSTRSTATPSSRPSTAPWCAPRSRAGPLPKSATPSSSAWWTRGGSSCTRVVSGPPGTVRGPARTRKRRASDSRGCTGRRVGLRRCWKSYPPTWPTAGTSKG